MVLDVQFGIVDDCFEFDFFDSNIGIQFATGLYDLLADSIIKTSS